jgi:mannose-6-phosphate isomerase-like protein (cupin superfamily)
MEILEVDVDDGRLIDRFDSRGARHIGVARLDGRGALSIIRLGADGVLGRHPAVVDQLFYVISGEGWVAGSDGARLPIRAGQAAYWTTGEEHESGSQSGMTALVVEAQQCAMK